MATIKVKRSPESKGRCKLAWNKVYNAEINSFNKDSYIIGNNVYLSKWFTPVTDQQPKLKPIVKTDPETGKLKVERDWSVPQAFPEGYVIKNQCRAVKVGETLDWIEKGAIGTIVPDGSPMPQFVCDDKSMYPEGWDVNEDGFFEHINELAPINPTNHPEHPDFGKIKGQSITKTWVDEFTKIEKENSRMILTTPEPHDIRDIIAEYIRKYGHELTAIELIGHLTIDKQ